LQETDAALLEIKSRVCVSRDRAQSLRESIEEVTALLNDKFRKGAFTSLDRDIRRLSNETTDLTLQFNIRSEKLNEHIEKVVQLNRFGLRKMRQEVAETKTRQQLAKQKIDQLKEEHAHKMKALRIQVLKLSVPTPIRVPDRRKLDRMRNSIAQLERGAAENQQAARGLDVTYRKLKSANERLRRERRRIGFLVGFPSGRPSEQRRLEES
jgi:chromosome segregation ATPase